MKYKKLVVVFILGMIIISPSIKNSLAQQSSGVEVQAGESYNWVLKLNISNYIELLTNTGGTISTELLALNLQGDSGGLVTVSAKLVILNIPDEYGVDSYFDLTFTIVEGEFTLVPDYNISQIPIFWPLNFSIKPILTSANFSILKGDTPNYFTVPIGFFLIVPTDLDWTVAAAQLQTEILSHLRSNYGITGASVVAQGNGLRISQPGDTTVLASELNLNYNSKGVLETADGSYNGAFLFSLELTSDGTIAFELPLFLIISVIAIAIVIFRRRKRFNLK